MRISHDPPFQHRKKTPPNQADALTDRLGVSSEYQGTERNREKPREHGPITCSSPFLSSVRFPHRDPCRIIAAGKEGCSNQMR